MKTLLRVTTLTSVSLSVPLCNPKLRLLGADTNWKIFNFQMRHGMRTLYHSREKTSDTGIAAARILSIRCSLGICEGFLESFSWRVELLTPWSSWLRVKLSRSSNWTKRASFYFVFWSAKIKRFRRITRKSFRKSTIVVLWEFIENWRELSRCLPSIDLGFWLESP